MKTEAGKIERHKYSMGDWAQTRNFRNRRGRNVTERRVCF